ncbi:MAG TPA: cation:proton antiporter [Sedimentisphaerales bacterium]|nr:cation:proton antiporter [Sedimentisphaerales bacterium]
MVRGLLNSISASGEGLSIILLIGLAIFCGTVGARIFQRLHIPQIVGFVAMGIILGPVLNIIPQKAVQSLELFNLVALGIIGFLVGGELKREIFVKFGKQVPIVLLYEGVTAFLLVGFFSFLAMWYFSDWQTALAVGVVFGAICSATDPASTIAVLWEYKARGPLTSMLTAIVTLDDALALVLYAISVSVAGLVTGHQESGFLTALAGVFYEMFGSVAIGVVSGVVLNSVLKRVDDSEKMLLFTISLVLLIIGAAITLGLDVILSAMALGVTLVNIKARKAQAAMEVLHKFSAPIYVLFFVLVGARVKFSQVNTMIWVLVAAYVTGSVAGKTLGSYLGGVFSGAVRTVKNYLGFCLYPQGGIAVGLLIMASHRFESNISSIMLLVVIIGAFILQMIGPIGVKVGAGKAGELGLNVTEEDLVKAYSVGDVLDATIPSVPAGASLSEVIRIVGATDSFYYPVVDNEKKLIGAVTMDGIRNTFATTGLNDWLVALDVMEPVVAKLTPNSTLSGAFEKMKQLDIEYLPVTASERDDGFIGVLNARAVHRKLSADVLAKQKEADRMYGLKPA